MRSLLLRRSAAVTAAAAASLALFAVPSSGAPRVTGGSSIDALKQDVQRTSDRLAAAVTRYQQGQVRLGGLLSQKVSTQRAVEQLQVDAQDARVRVASLANALYRDPVGPSLRAALDGNVLTVFDLQYLQQRDKRTTADQRKDASLLDTQVAQAEHLLVTQDRAATEAIKLQTQLDEELSGRLRRV